MMSSIVASNHKPNRTKMNAKLFEIRKFLNYFVVSSTRESMEESAAMIVLRRFIEAQLPGIGQKRCKFLGISIAELLHGCRHFLTKIIIEILD